MDKEGTWLSDWTELRDKLGDLDGHKHTTAYKIDN